MKSLENTKKQLKVRKFLCEKALKRDDLDEISKAEWKKELKEITNKLKKNENLGQQSKK